MKITRKQIRNLILEVLSENQDPRPNIPPAFRGYSQWASNTQKLLKQYLEQNPNFKELFYDDSAYGDYDKIIQLADLYGSVVEDGDLAVLLFFIYEIGYKASDISNTNRGKSQRDQEANNEIVKNLYVVQKKIKDEFTNLSGRDYYIGEKRSITKWEPGGFVKK